MQRILLILKLIEIAQKDQRGEKQTHILYDTIRKRGERSSKVFTIFTKVHCRCLDSVVERKKTGLEKFSPSFARIKLVYKNRKKAVLYITCFDMRFNFDTACRKMSSAKLLTKIFFFFFYIFYFFFEFDKI